jgi:hypothetical protein
MCKQIHATDCCEPANGYTQVLDNLHQAALQENNFFDRKSDFSKNKIRFLIFKQSSTWSGHVSVCVHMC